MANRIIPFGYEVSDGKIVIIEREADVVKNIFSLYVQGLSLKSIADRINILQISYTDDRREWNKNIIKRIIENKKYAGEQNYPMIIPIATIEMALKCKSGRYVETDKDNKCRQDAYRGRMICQSCGEKMKRTRAGSGRTKRAYWKCPNTDCEFNKHVFNEDKLNEIMASFVNELCKDLSQIDYQEEKKYEKNPMIIRLSNEMNDAIDNIETDSDTVIKTIMNLASAKFDLCKTGNNSVITQNIKKELAIYPKAETVDGKMIDKIVKTIQITPDKQICIELVNGKRFEREYT